MYKKPIFSIDFSKKSMINDQLCYGNSVTTKPFLKTNKGFACFSNKITFSNFNFNFTNNFTQVFVVYVPYSPFGVLDIITHISPTTLAREPFIRITNQWSLLNVIFYNVIDPFYISPSFNLHLNKVNFIVFSHLKNEKIFNVYINNEKKIVTYTYNLVSVTDSLPIIKNTTVNNGLLSLKVYDYILTDKQIQDLYTNFLKSNSFLTKTVQYR